jgi:hypothetical protein
MIILFNTLVFMRFIYFILDVDYRLCYQGDSRPSTVMSLKIPIGDNVQLVINIRRVDMVVITFVSEWMLRFF